MLYQNELCKNWNTSCSHCRGLEGGASTAVVLVACVHRGRHGRQQGQREATTPGLIQKHRLRAYVVEMSAEEMSADRVI
jgi:hypothetical protein